MLVCVKACFFRNRLWKVGETISPKAGEAIPAHFAPGAKVDRPEREEPKTLADAQAEVDGRPVGLPALPEDLPVVMPRTLKEAQDAGLFCDPFQ